MFYYRYMYYIGRTVGADAKSIIDIGSNNCAYLSWFYWIKDKSSLDLHKPFEAPDVQSIKADFLTWEPNKIYDLVICLQVLEHLPEQQVLSFARKLLNIGKHIILSVPYQWPAGSANHVHDPVTREKLDIWMGREPNESYIVSEPFRGSARSMRLVAYYDKEDPSHIIKKSDRLKQRPSIHEINFNLNNNETDIKNNKTEEMWKLQVAAEELKTERRLNNELMAKIDKYEERIDMLKGQFQTIRIELKTALQERKSYELYYLEVKNSSIWRYSLPLRKMGNYIKKGFYFFSRYFPKKTEKKPDDNSPMLSQKFKKDNIEKLKEEYSEKGLNAVPDTFVLYRVIGNDLYPRHKTGQSRENLLFILENETELAGCEKRWVINRIINKDEEKAIMELLTQYNQEYINIPFVPEEYKKIGWDVDCYPKVGFLFTEEFDALEPEQRDRAILASYRLKNNYVMNNNGARNTALRDGKNRAKWVLPWDGNCFITQSAWQKIVSGVKNESYLKFFVVPMSRVENNKHLLSGRFMPDPVEEPQILFRSDTIEEFNEEFCYGRRPKVEIFWRLGIPGKWDRWIDDPWDKNRRPLSSEAYQFGVVGWVARLFSGMKNLEQKTKMSFYERGVARREAIASTINHVDVMVSGGSANPDKYSNLIEDKVGKGNALSNEKSAHFDQLIRQLIVYGEGALNRTPYSVTDKTTLPPSGKKNDYWHPAPYWWPNPSEPDGIPYIQKDGERIPGTRLYEPESEKYDRTRLQRVFDDSIILALCCKYTGEKKYAEHGAKILKRFFLDTATRMNPHLKYAQVRMGHNDNIGASSGIIEMKDLYYYLDAVRLFVREGVVIKKDLDTFKDWVFEYLEWLIKSPQGRKECKATNNHGTYYDLQIASIAGFLNETSLFFETMVRAQCRIAAQFATDGSQPHELTRKTTAHYCCFNYQGWINLAEIASRWGTDLWAYESPEGAGLINGARWLLSHLGGQWPYEQIDRFDYDRFYPVLFSIPAGRLELPAGIEIPESVHAVKPVFYPHDGIRPFWNLG